MSSTVASVNDILEEDEGGLSGFTILAILATLLMVFMLVVYYAYRQGMARASTFSEELPVQVADPTPYAEDVPLDIARTEREEVMDIINGTAPATQVITQEDPGRDALNGYGRAPAKMAQDTPAIIEEPLEEPVTLAAAPERSATPAASTTPVVTPPSRKPRVQPQTAPVRSQTTASTTTAPRPASTLSAVSGSHVVQVGAFDSNAAALSFYEGLSGRMGTLLNDKRPDVQVAEVKGKTYHRLRVGPFTSQAEAANYCSQLKNRGQDCLVRGI